MRSTTASVRAGSAALVLFVLAGTAAGQDVLTNGDAPFAWQNPYAPANTNPADRINQGNVTNAQVDRQTRNAANQVLVLWGRATATEDGNAVRDRFNFTMGGTQEFEVRAGGANLWAPLWLNGRINFFQNAAAPNANFAVGSLRAEIEFKIWDGTNYVSRGAGEGGPIRASLDYTRDAQVNPAGGDTDQYRMLRFDGAAAGRYRLDVTYTFSGEADARFARQSDNGSGVTAGAYFQNANDLTSGVMTALGYAPSAALPNSRTRVTAPQARAEFGVDGSGVSIALMEIGRVIDTHDAFAGGKVTQLRQRLDQPAGDVPLPGGGTERRADGRTEHTTAVAGIAAGAAGDSSQRGVAPGADIISAPLAAYASSTEMFDALASSGARIMNMSAFFNTLPTQHVDSHLSANPRFLFVKSAGNAGAPAGGGNTITNPGMNYNGIAVGALDQDMEARATFSSFNNGGSSLRKPDIVAPGDYITAPVAIDVNNDGNVNDFDQRFTGVGARYHDSEVNTGGTSGTSFAAPHVSGAAALMMEYRDNKVAAGDWDVNSDDSRVIKAVMMNTARRDGIGLWKQKGDNVGSQSGVVIRESLDRELGSGLLDTRAAMRNYAAGEIRLADNNNQQHVNISVPAAQDGGRRAQMWDLERVAGALDGPPGGGSLEGTVNYLLGAELSISQIAETGQLIGTMGPGFSFLRAALTWHRTVTAGAYDPLPHLEMRLYMDDVSPSNQRGFDPADPTADHLIARTEGVGENVKLFDLSNLGGISQSINFGTSIPLIWEPTFYLQVINLSGGGFVDFGISITIPAPGAVSMLAVLGVLAARRRRA
jgi:hypothetical protein